MQLTLNVQTSGPIRAPQGVTPNGWRFSLDGQAADVLGATAVFDATPGAHTATAQRLDDAGHPFGGVVTASITVGDELARLVVVGNGSDFAA